MHLTVAVVLHLMAQAVSNTPFEWASQHLHLVAWPTIVGIVAKVSWKISKSIQQTKSQVEKTVEQIDTMALNHFPHMEKALVNMDKNIRRLAYHTTGEADVLE